MWRIIYVRIGTDSYVNFKESSVKSRVKINESFEESHVKINKLCEELNVKSLHESCEESCENKRIIWGVC